MNHYGDRDFERIGGAEALDLARLPDTKLHTAAEGGFSDGEILMVFHLSDGRTLRYVARQESDYYGGHYDEIEWWISR